MYCLLRLSLCLFVCCGVKEGFLLGNVIKVVTNSISDADINVIKHQIVYST